MKRVPMSRGRGGPSVRGDRLDRRVPPCGRVCGCAPRCARRRRPDIARRLLKPRPSLAQRIVRLGTVRVEPLEISSSCPRGPGPSFVHHDLDLVARPCARSRFMTPPSGENDSACSSRWLITRPRRASGPARRRVRLPGVSRISSRACAYPCEASRRFRSRLPSTSRCPRARLAVGHSASSLDTSETSVMSLLSRASSPGSDAPAPRASPVSCRPAIQRRARRRERILRSWRHLAPRSAGWPRCADRASGHLSGRRWSSATHRCAAEIRQLRPSRTRLRR